MPEDGLVVRRGYGMRSREDDIAFTRTVDGSAVDPSLLHFSFKFLIPAKWHARKRVSHALTPMVARCITAGAVTHYLAPIRCGCLDQDSSSGCKFFELLLCPTTNPAQSLTPCQPLQTPSFGADVQTAALQITLAVRYALSYMIQYCILHTARPQSTMTLVYL